MSHAFRACNHNDTSNASFTLAKTTSLSSSTPPISFRMIKGGGVYLNNSKVHESRSIPAKMEEIDRSIDALLP